MTQVLRRGAALGFQLVVLPFAIVMILLHWGGHLFAHLYQGWIRHFYYPMAVLRRRIAAEPTWKEIDWQIGIGPPEGHPQYVAPQTLEGAGPTQPMCHVCRATPGFVEVCEACQANRGCVAHGMTGCVPCDHCQIVPCGTCDGPTACCHPDASKDPEHQCGRCAHVKERKAS